MKIHLLSSAEVQQEKFDNVLEILQKSKGPLKFISHPNAVEIEDDKVNPERFEYKNFRNQKPVREIPWVNEERIYSLSYEYPEVIYRITWDYIFNQCEHFRTAENIPADEYIILLTDYSNDQNWFGAADPSGKNNFFVHAAQWEHFVPTGDPRFPIAYEVMANILHKLMFSDYNELARHVHKEPRGCINDFCQYKKQITFKLRTADICDDCQELLREKKVDPSVVNQVFKVMDDIRTQMLFRERFKTTQQLSRLRIEGPECRIYFTDLGNAELKLTPLEKVVYLLYLEHPEGLRLTELCDHSGWLINKYIEIGGNGTLPEIKDRITRLCDATQDVASEQISRIKRKIESVVGEELAPNYIIKGDRGESKKIEYKFNENIRVA